MRFVQYGVEHPNGVIEWDEDWPREKAILMAKALTQRTKESHVAVERWIESTEWKPLNTGIVGEVPTGAEPEGIGSMDSGPVEVMVQVPPPKKATDVPWDGRS